MSFRTGFYSKRIVLVPCVSIIALVFNTGAQVPETMTWPAAPVTQAQAGPSITSPTVTSPFADGNSYELAETITGELTYDAPAPTHRGPTSPPEPRVQGDTLPVVTLGSVTPSPVRPSGRLTITVHINPPLPADAIESDKITGGILAFDSWQYGGGVDDLIAFVFRAGQVTRTISYTVLTEDDGDVEPSTTDREIRIEINPVFDEYRVGQP